jgi:ArsR family transcriptional regulator
MRFMCRDMERFGRGVGNAARAQIVESLIEGPKTVTQLTSVVGLSQSAVSQHLSKLKECKIVTDERNGQEVLYTFNSGKVVGMFSSLLNKLHASKSK